MFWSVYLGYPRICWFSDLFFGISQDIPKKKIYLGISFKILLCFGISFVLSGICLEPEAESGWCSRSVAGPATQALPAIESAPLPSPTMISLTPSDRDRACCSLVMLYVGCRGRRCWLSSLSQCLQQCWYLAHQALAYSSMATSTPTCPLESSAPPPFEKIRAAAGAASSCRGRRC